MTRNIAMPTSNNIAPTKSIHLKPWPIPVNAKAPEGDETGLAVVGTTVVVIDEAVVDVDPAPDVNVVDVVEVVDSEVVNVKVSAVPVAEVPIPLVTVTSTAPAACAGEAAMIVVSLVTVNSAVTMPKSTAVAPVNPVPVTVTDVPPAVDPEVGLTPVTVGPEGGVV